MEEISVESNAHCMAKHFVCPLLFLCYFSLLLLVFIVQQRNNVFLLHGEPLLTPRGAGRSCCPICRLAGWKASYRRPADPSPHRALGCPHNGDNDNTSNSNSKTNNSDHSNNSNNSGWTVLPGTERAWRRRAPTGGCTYTLDKTIQYGYCQGYLSRECLGHHRKGTLGPWE